MLKDLKIASVRLMQRAGVFERASASRWRRERLLILCYHAVSIADEHEWRPNLCMSPALLRARFEAIRRGGYQVLPLDQAVKRLYKNDLPPRSVVLTFDDGGYDFYKQAAPILREFGYPATVYQTTFYSDYPKPVFRTASSYLLWKCREQILPADSSLGIAQPVDLHTEAARGRVTAGLFARCDGENLSGEQRNELLQRLAKLLGLDYSAFEASRLLQLMRPQEIAEMSAEGFDIQLHTHQHRTPLDEQLFRREISDNQKRISEICGTRPTHFCYPSGHYEMAFLPWLEKGGVVSATTCDPGLADRESHPLLLPRFIDTSGQPLLMFEAWLSGVGQWVSARRKAKSALSGQRPAMAEY